MVLRAGQTVRVGRPGGEEAGQEPHPEPTGRMRPSPLARRDQPGDPVEGLESSGHLSQAASGLSGESRMSISCFFKPGETAVVGRGARAGHLEPSSFPFPVGMGIPEEEVCSGGWWLRVLLAKCLVARKGTME